MTELVEQGFLTAFGRYERALMADDLVELDELFTPGAATLRADGTSALVGSGHIAEFRAGRGGAPARWLRRVHVRWITGDDVHVVAETERVGGAGVQTQWWRRTAGEWRILAAHVSGGADAVRGGPSADLATWRVHTPSLPVVPGPGQGPLHGVRLAVKDLVAVQGQWIGGGVPALLAAADVEPANAPALQRLLDAGAEVTGIAHTDELAFSLMGVNDHYGTPRNPVAPGRVPGGSTSGPAAAVAAGAADVGLGTDTAGSLRVPGSYCGLYAWRPTHGVVPVEGVLPLAQDFDTVGLLARSGSTLAAAGRVLLGDGVPGARPRALLRSAALWGLASPETALAAEAVVTALSAATGITVHEVDVELGDPAVWTAAFRTVQAAQAWQNHGEFLTANPHAVSAGVAARFRAGAAVSQDQLKEARAVIAQTRDRLDGALATGWLCLPSSSTPAPPVDSTPEQFELVRTPTLQLTTLASLAGVPVLGLPWGRVGQLPVGLSVLAPRGSDAGLLDLAEETGPPSSTP